MRTLNYRTRFIELASEINSSMPEYVVDKTSIALNDDRKSVKGSRILVLGVAYKRDIDDMRESPALDVIRLLEERGATVDYHDPHIPSYREEGHVRTGVPLTDEAITGADAIVIITDHRAIDYARLVAKGKVIVDTRNALAKLPAGRARIVTLAKR